MKIFETRNDMILEFPKKCVFAELGVFEGNFSDVIIDSINPSELFLVDIWNGSMTSGDKDGKDIKLIRNMYDVYQGLVEKHKNNNFVKIIRSNTHEFLSNMHDEYFDVIYVDASHSYRDVLIDMELSYQKIKNGGIISGHDYIPNYDVTHAVNDFCKKYNQEVIGITSDGCPSFMIKVQK